MSKLPPPIWMFLFIATAGIASWLAHIPFEFRYWPIGAVLLLIGVALALSAVRLFRRAGTEIDPMSVTNKALVVDGPFRLTRNPMYLSLVLFSLGVAAIAGAWPLFVVPVLVFAVSNWAHIPIEEAKMRRQFGAAFDGYTAKVRRWV